MFVLIQKILNNNAFISFDENGSEIIVTGKGVAFGKKQGQEVELKGNFKIFSDEDKKLNKKLKNIVSDIPEEYINIVDQAVFLLEKECNKKINDIIYISLTDHIYGAVERAKKGIHLKNPLLHDIKILFKDEFEISKQILKKIKEQFNVEFEEDEAGYIAQHLVNAQLDTNILDFNDVAEIIQEILKVIKHTYKIEFNQDSIYYNRFVTHLKFFAQRILSKNCYEDNNEEIFEVFKTKYLDNYNCVQKIYKFIENVYNYKLSKDEQLYLMIHIERITNKSSV